MMAEANPNDCNGVTCFCCKPIDLKQRTEKPGSYKSLSQYKKDRRRGIKRNAFTWDQVVFEMEMAIGKEDAQAAIKGMENMLNDPYFERDPVRNFSLHFQRRANVF